METKNKKNKVDRIRRTMEFIGSVMLSQKGYLVDCARVGRIVYK